MELNLIKIGTSKGIRIPSKVLKQMNCPDKFNLNITEYGLFLKPIKNETRSNWKERFISSQSNCLAEKYL